MVKERHPLGCLSFVTAIVSLLLRSIVTLDGLGLNDDAGVGFLPELALGGDGPCDVARTHRDSEDEQNKEHQPSDSGKNVFHNS